jgi:mercuric ion transport protein
MPREMTMPTVELLFIAECPNVPAAREVLRRAMEQAGLQPSWSEYDVTEPGAPAHTRGFGSPTILVEGNDVTGSAPSAGGCSCRVYPGSEVRGVPPLEGIVRALLAGRSPPSSSRDP